jgi:trehalose 6-phosphate synthase/phosphatase
MRLTDTLKSELLQSYQKASNRLILLDYDGTLVSFSSLPDLAVPGDILTGLLNKLGTNNPNDVFLISGRSSKWLEKYFGATKIHLIAEHGAKVKWESEWQLQFEPQTEWKSFIRKQMVIAEQLCRHSFIEEKEFSIVWHYRNAEVTQGEYIAADLISALKKTLNDSNLEVIPGNKIVEVRTVGVNKGTAVKKIVEKRSYDFILAIGDDTTDEDMFKTLSNEKGCFTIKIGASKTCAMFTLALPSMTISLLEEIVSLDGNSSY